jgi:hypothetical protein
MSTGDRVKELRYLQEATGKIIIGVVAGEIPPRTGAVVNDAVQLLLDLIDLEDKLERRAATHERV